MFPPGCVCGREAEREKSRTQVFLKLSFQQLDVVTSVLLYTKIEPCGAWVSFSGHLVMEVLGVQCAELSGAEAGR